MIPKIIHYVWVGDKPKPDSVKRCIESWKKHCPDYEIKEWGNEVLKDINNTYVTEAFEAKKWAFVADYIRLYVLYQEGGIYLDTDEELFENIDAFLKDDFILSHENYHGEIGLSMGFIGAAKKHEIVKDMLSFYDGLKFKKEDDVFDMMPMPKRFTSYFEQNFGLDAKKGDQITKIKEGCLVYPWWYFCTPKGGEKSYAVHHYDGTWLDAYKRKNMLSGFGFMVVRFKKNPYTPDEDLPLKKGEKMLWRLALSRKRIYVLICKKRAKILL